MVCLGNMCMDTLRKGDNNNNNNNNNNNPMQGNNYYIPETNYVSIVYSVAALLYLQLVLHVMLLRPRNMFCTFTLALSAVCVQCPLWLYCVVP